MTKFILSLVFIMSLGLISNANELDNEAQVTNQQLQGTVIVRIDSRDQSTAMIHTDVAFKNNQMAQAFAIQTDFKLLDSAHVKTELDNDGGTSSWYHYHHYNNNYYNNNNNYYYPNNYFYWYGNYYQPCYSYSYGYYNYYYYTPYYWGR